MYAIVIGAGEVGFNIAQRLSEENHDVVVVDVNDTRLERCRDFLDVLTVRGSGSRESTLVEAGIERARMLIAVTDHDEVNIVACLIAQTYGTRHRIARIIGAGMDPRGSRLTAEHLGVSEVINPNKETVREITSLLQHSSASEVVEYAGGRLTLVRVPVTDGAPIVGKELRDLVRDDGDRRTYLIVAVQRGGRTIVPHGDDMIRQGDEIIAMCESGHVRDVTFLAGQRDSKIGKVMIVGGGDLGSSLASSLEQLKVSVVLIENDRSVCADLNDELGRTLILQGDGTDISLLRSEGVGEMDAFIALTPDEENNILASLMARHHGCRKVITRIRRPDYVSIMASIGIDAAISKRTSTVSGVLRFVRKGAILSVTLFQDTDAEVIELRASKGSVMVDLPLHRIRFPQGALIGAVIRDGEGSGAVEIASGDTVIAAGDRVVVFALKDAVAKVEELFG